MKTIVSDLTELAHLAREYARLEKAARRRIGMVCGVRCAACSSVCCRPSFCRESLDSPFLSLVRRSQLPGAAWDTRSGWLGPAGCRLPAGRPPVCYAFFCRAIEDDQPTEAHRQALRELSNLMNSVGCRAAGSRHLVEVEDLARIRPDRLRRRIASAGVLLLSLSALWDTGCGARPLPDQIDCLAQAGGGGSAPREPSW